MMEESELSQRKIQINLERIDSLEMKILQLEKENRRI
jgi:hypothetical protein